MVIEINIIWVVIIVIIAIIIYLLDLIYFKVKSRVLSYLKYDKFFNIAESLFIIIEPSGKIIKFNAEFDRFARETLSKQYNNFFYYLDAKTFEGFTNETVKLDGEATAQFETILISTDIKKHTVVWTITKDVTSSQLYLSGKYMTNELYVNEQLQLAEAKSRKQFKSIPFPTYTWKRITDDFILIDFNDIVYHETDGKAQHLLGITASKLLKNNHEIISDMDKCFITRNSIKKEVKYMQDDTGEHKFYNVNYAFVPSDVVIVQMEDITFKKLVEIEIHEKEEKYRQLYNTPHDSIFLVNQEGRIIEYNNSALNKFGYTEEELTSKYIFNLIKVANTHGNDDIISDAEAFILDLFNISMIDGFVEIICEKKNLETFPADAQIQFTTIKENNILIIFIRDITQRKQMEKALYESQTQLKKSVIELKRYSDDLERANQELKIYTYIISHDLKAPLRAISNIVEWLFEDYSAKFDDEGKNLLNLLLNRSSRMHDLIESILKYAKIGKSDIEIGSIDLNKLIKSTVELLHIPSNITVKAPSDLPTIETYDVYLQQVLQNLISNALKFTTRADGLVEIGFENYADEYLFWVKDNGDGIDSQYFSKVFQLFQTLDNKYEKENTGVGLSIVKKIIDTLHGKIWIESKLKEGTTFFFTLPKE